MSAHCTPLDAYPLPPRLPENPYLDLLYAPMAAFGVRVRRGRPRAMLPALLASRRPRVLHLHFFDELTQRPGARATALRSLAFVALVRAAQASGAALVWTAHNLAPHECFHPRWAERVYRLVAAGSAATIAHSHAARRQIEARYAPRRVDVIPHGHYVDVYGPQQDRAAARRALGLGEPGPLTVCLGALRPYKQIEALIDAFATLPANGRGTLLVVGKARDRAYAAELQRRASGVAGVRIEARYVPGAELARYLGAADLVALPYRQVLTSGMLMLALSYARPALAPDVGAVRELVEDGREAILFQPDRPAALAEGLARALACDRDAIGRRGLERALQFGWGPIARATCEVYHDVTR
jgi:glycosyltransferase involved in cell wall biosynthesis